MLCYMLNAELLLQLQLLGHREKKLSLLLHAQLFPRPQRITHGKPRVTHSITHSLLCISDIRYGDDYFVNFAMAYLLDIRSEDFFGALLYLIHVWKIAATRNKEEKMR